MKTILILLFCLLACSAQAGITLEWDDDQTGVTYKVYEKQGAAWVAVATTTEKKQALTPIPGVHVYAVTANSQHGESERSNEATTTVPPNAPKSLRIILDATITIMESK